MRILSFLATIIINIFIMALVILYIPANLIAALVGAIRRKRS